jgi:hypothetical protein
MKFLFVSALVCVTFFSLSGCSGKPKPGLQGGFVPPADLQEQAVADAPPQESAQEKPPVDAPETPPPAPPRVGNYDYGKPVPGKPGFVTSPYAPASGYVDVRGFPPGTEVMDPYTQKIFLVP